MNEENMYVTKIEQTLHLLNEKLKEADKLYPIKREPEYKATKQSVSNNNYKVTNKKPIKPEVVVNNDDDGFVEGSSNSSTEHVPTKIDFITETDENEVIFVTDLDEKEPVAQPKHKNLKYLIENLTSEQKFPYVYVEENPNHIILIQAPPGAGKTHLLLTMANNLKRSILIVIYKHDLLSHFSGLASTATNTKFFMHLFKLSYFEINSHFSKLTSNVADYVYFQIFFDLFSRMSHLDPNYLYVFDEYTQIPKPILLMLLIMGRMFNIAMIFCGDCNQLQAIQSAVKFNTASSFDIVSMFAHKKFTLNTINRCKDLRYNEVVGFVSKLVSDKKIDQVGYAILAAVYPRSLLTTPTTKDIFMGAEHHLINTMFHNTFSQAKSQEINTLPPDKHEHFGSVYMIDGRKVIEKEKIRGVHKGDEMYTTLGYEEYENNGAKITKFMPYLPLIVGNEYYVKMRRRPNLCKLLKYDEVLKVATVQNQFTGAVFNVTYDDCSLVVIDALRDWLMGKFQKDDKLSAGHLINYPMYPTFIMSSHMAQGNTIPEEKTLVVIAPKLTYHGLYVVMSRVQKPSQIRHVQIVNTMSMIVSTVFNFNKMLLTPEKLVTAQELTEVFDKGYFYIQTYKLNNYDIVIKALNIINNDNVTEGELVTFRNEVLEMARNQELFIEKLTLDEVKKNAKLAKMKADQDKNCVTKKDSDTVTIDRVQLVYNYQPVYLALSVLKKFERDVWYKMFNDFIQMHSDTTEYLVFDTPRAMLESIDKQKHFIIQYCRDNETILKSASRKYKMSYNDVHKNFCRWYSKNGYKYTKRIYQNLNAYEKDPDNFVFFGSQLIREMFTTNATLNVNNLIKLLNNHFDRKIKETKESMERLEKERIREQREFEEEANAEAAKTFGEICKILNEDTLPEMKPRLKKGTGKSEKTSKRASKGQSSDSKKQRFK